MIERTGMQTSRRFPHFFAGTRSFGKWYHEAANFWGMEKMKKLVVVILFLSIGVFLSGQDRATMSAPVIRATPEGVTFSASFTDLSPGGEYRLGLATAGGKLTGSKVELLKNGTAIQLQPTDFDQNYTSNWWNVPKVTVHGFSLAGTNVPAKTDKLTLRVTVSKEELDKQKKVYMLVARKYGEGVWYLEDGVEMNETNW